jgi:LPXTG-site transpeptidase (sortase) family protein
MKKKEKIKLKRIKIIKVFSFIFIGTGLLLIFYPVYTNFIATSQELAVLSAWDEQKEELFEQGGDEEVVEESGEVSVDGTEIEDDPGFEIDITSGEVSVYENLTTEDFFPLKISIPKIELVSISYEGTDSQTLKKGPGHESVTPLPGDIGRSTISGHRTTYGAPFNRVDELEEGDLIYLETIKDESFIYRVTGLDIVKPTDVWILKGSDKKELLLTTCDPKYSAANRLIIIAELIEIYPFEIEL